MIWDLHLSVRGEVCSKHGQNAVFKEHSIYRGNFSFSRNYQRFSDGRKAMSAWRQNKVIRTAKALPERVREVFETPGLEVPDGHTAEHMLQLTEAFWKAMKDPIVSKKLPPKVVKNESTTKAPVEDPHEEFDVCVAGGTLGIFIALGLQKKGYSVCIVEKRLLEGRSQEWNISWKELWNGLVKTELLTDAEIRKAVVTHWNASSVSIKDLNLQVSIENVLNLGVSPKILIGMLRSKFLEVGGTIYDFTAFKSVTVYKDKTIISLGRTLKDDLTIGDVNRPTAFVADVENKNPSAPKEKSSMTSERHVPQKIASSLLIDAMGHYSPIAKQARNGEEPSGMVLVVGGCMKGPFSDSQNETADLLATIDDSFDDMQLFWEAFPAEGGSARTVYMFLYSDTHPSRPKFVDLLDMYLALLPRYQGVELSDLRFKRILLGGFPCYQANSPLKPAFDRILQVGDAAASQSPLSFGGFTAMVHHLPRLMCGIDDALSKGKTGKKELAWLQPYQPALSVSWLFQKSMSLQVGQLRAPKSPCRGKPVELRSDIAASAIKASFANGNHSNDNSGMGWLHASHINRVLRCNFAVMHFFGKRILKPFVLDSMQFGPLALTMIGMMFKDPISVSTVIFQVGFGQIVNWFGHFFALAVYRIGFLILSPFRRVLTDWYTFQRLIDALQYGSSSERRFDGSEEEATVCMTGDRTCDDKPNTSAPILDGHTSNTLYSA